MKTLARLVSISILLTGAFGCSAESSEKIAADARTQAADARVNAADANARVAAADAHVTAADANVDAAAADARVKEASKNTGVFNARQARLVIASGTRLKVSLIDALSSDTSSAGDRFLVSLAESVAVDGTTVLERGTMIRGRVIGVQGSGRVKGRASIRLALTDIMQGSTSVPITTETFSATAESSTTRDAEIIAGGAGVGAVIGAIAGGGKGAGIGALVGGGGGTGVVLATKGKEIHFGPETRLNFTLANSVEM
jgi:hypothetical protein